MLQAADPPAGDDATRALAAMREAAGRYRILLEESPARTLLLKDDPLLRWGNPLRKTSVGAVFLWTSQGRPEAIASFYRYVYEGTDREDHEFQSLSTRPLSATRDGIPVWSPPGPGVKFAPIPGAPVPAESAAARLRQMKALTQEFRATFDIPEDRSELRLLTQPLFRYEPQAGSSLMDGALFAFVQTTDPEVLLLLEARPEREAGPVVWQFAFARMSMVNLRAEHRGKEVWKVDWVNDRASPGKPYVTIPAAPASR